MLYTLEQLVWGLVINLKVLVSYTDFTDCQQIRDYPLFLNELAQTLRPGGVILLADGDMQLYDDQQRPMPFKTLGEPGFSWTHKVFFASYNAMKSRGSSVDPPLMNPTWLRSIDSLTDVGWDKIYIPIGPWMYSRFGINVGLDSSDKNFRGSA